MFGDGDPENTKIMAEEVRKLAQEGKIRTLPRLGEKHEAKLLKAIQDYRRISGRFLIDNAEEAAEKLGAAWRSTGNAWSGAGCAAGNILCTSAWTRPKAPRACRTNGSSASIHRRAAA